MIRVVLPTHLRTLARVNGEVVLHLEATLAAPMFEAAFDDLREATRRWLPSPG